MPPSQRTGSLARDGLVDFSLLTTAALLAAPAIRQPLDLTLGDGREKRRT